MHAFSQTKGKSLTRDSIREVRSVHYGMVRKGQCMGLTVALNENFCSVKLNVKVKGKGHPCTGTEALYRPYGS